MEQSIRISSKSRLRNNKRKTQTEEKITIENAYYLGAFTILLFFSNGKQKKFDFLPLFSKYVKGDFTKYALPSAFKKFRVANGNIYWGKNEEVIFPVDFLYSNKNATLVSEEILYVI